MISLHEAITYTFTISFQHDIVSNYFIVEVGPKQSRRHLATTSLPYINRNWREQLNVWINYSKPCLSRNVLTKYTANRLSMLTSNRQWMASDCRPPNKSTSLIVHLFWRQLPTRGRLPHYALHHPLACAVRPPASHLAQSPRFCRHFVIAPFKLMYMCSERA